MQRFVTPVFYLLAVFLCCSPLGHTGQLLAAQLHGVLVGDTLSEDLVDSIWVDLQSIERHLADIAKSVQMGLRVHKLVGEGATSDSVINSLNELQTAQEDVVFFYFSGHGFRTASKEGNPWPNLYFTADQTGVDELDIAHILKNKNAHLSIVIADCCNNVLLSYQAPPLAGKQLTKSKHSKKTEKNIRKLFVETHGVVLAASSKAGQSSWTKGAEGSLYTAAYVDTFRRLIKQVDSEVIGWQFVMDQSAYKMHQITNKLGVIQDPIFTINP